tara:strand:- start:6619 stop:7683 length:1065 start_codon:yes stop_codon:yes gene_type:complete
MARTFSVYENPNSRKLQIQTPGAGSSVFSYEFTIRPVSGTEGTTDEEYQAAYNALRTHLGVPIGKLTDISAYSTSPFGSLGSVRSINMEHEPAADHVYRAVVTWQSEFPAIYDSENTDRMVISGQAAINYSSQPAVRMFDMYKRTALPTTAQQTAAATAGGFYHSDYLVDVGNTTYNSETIESVDVAGRPLKVPALQIEVVIDEPWASSSDLVQNTQLGLWPRWDANSDFIYKRNSAAFMSFPAGTLLYLGTTTSPRQFHTHTLSHRFLYDEFEHFEQVTFQSVTGIENISAIDNFPGSSLSASCSKMAYWTNHYHTTSFGNFTWANAATASQVSNGLVDWSASSGDYAGPITQ